MKNEILISPSLLSADFGNLKADLDKINASEADWLHIEVKDLGAMMMNVHFEACPHLHRVVQQIKEAGMKAGVTLNPATPVSMLADIIEEVDMVLLMSVNPGFGGQKFIPHTLKKVRELRELITATGSHALIEVDGGVNLQTAPSLIEAGADVLVAGNALFKADDMIGTIHQLKNMK